jgi:hypothetical protein
MDDHEPPTHTDASEPTTDRRALLKKAVVAGGLFWTMPAIDSVLSPAAAASGTTTVGVFKTINGNNFPDPPLATLCTVGAVGNSGRGSATFVRSESPATICVTVTLSTGTSAVGRDVYILQSSSVGCVGGSATRVGVWAASPALGPQTFCAPVDSGAAWFVVALQLSGGGGVDGWSSTRANLP